MMEIRFVESELLPVEPDTFVAIRGDILMEPLTLVGRPGFWTAERKSRILVGLRLKGVAVSEHRT